MHGKHSTKHLPNHLSSSQGLPDTGKGASIDPFHPLLTPHGVSLAAILPYAGGDLTVDSAVGHWLGLEFYFHVHGNSEGFLGVP